MCDTNARRPVARPFMSPRQLRAHLILKRNIDALLHERHLRRKDLAQWCHRTEGWLSQIFTDDEKNIPLKYLDRIADFFGKQTYEMFQPGLTTGSLERRKLVDRRTGTDRRASKDVKLPPTATHVLQALDGLKPADVRHLLRVARALRQSADDAPGTANPGDRGPIASPLSERVPRTRREP